MALRLRMHPKNIYKNPPNFKELAIDYPEFRKYVKQDLSGRVYVDFNDRKAVMELTKILLLRDFNLRVEMNETRLIPRVPLCLNYVLWIEELLSTYKPKEIRGIDIGTGSVCIYSLLASTKGWNMLATEIDRISYESAVENVKKNSLTDQITVKFVDDNRLLNGVIDYDLVYDFCMCNPPFFDNTEKPMNRTKRRKMIETVASYVHSDVITEGGEVEFIKKLINESQTLKDKIKIYTTLIGKKSDFIELKKQVLRINPDAITETEFCQGKTIRWGLAWSFAKLNFSELSKNSMTNSKKIKTKLLQFSLHVGGGGFQKTVQKTEAILRDLKIRFTKECISEGHVFTLKAYENTWSHQRQKRRLMKRRISAADRHCNIQENLDEQEKLETQGSIDNCDPPSKKIKLNESVNDVTKAWPSDVLVECLLSVKQDGESIILALSWLSGKKECVHEIYQYIKNNWDK